MLHNWKSPLRVVALLFCLVWLVPGCFGEKKGNPDASSKKPSANASAKSNANAGAALHPKKATHSEIVCDPDQIPSDHCVIYVDGRRETSGCGYHWEDSVQSIQDGIDQAAAALEDISSFTWCEVWVATGKYYTYTSSRSDTVALSPGVELFGGFDGDETRRGQRDFDKNETIISGQKKGDKNKTVFHVVTGADNAVIDGFVVRDGKATGPRYGAGMYNDRVSPTIRNCTFINNVAGWYGGGMFNNHNAPIVENCLFIENEAYSGGAMCNQVSTAQIIDTVFEENVADEYGGGMFNHSNSNVSISDSLFENNEAGHLGGAISNRFRSSSTLENCDFSNNSAEEDFDDIHGAKSGEPPDEEDYGTSGGTAYQTGD